MAVVPTVEEIEAMNLNAEGIIKKAQIYKKENGWNEYFQMEAVENWEEKAVTVLNKRFALQRERALHRLDIVKV